MIFIEALALEPVPDREDVSCSVEGYRDICFGAAGERTDMRTDQTHRNIHHTSLPSLEYYSPLMSTHTIYEVPAVHSSLFRYQAS